jgi:hypothetical protein
MRCEGVDGRVIGGREEGPGGGEGRGGGEGGAPLHLPHRLVEVELGHLRVQVRNWALVIRMNGVKGERCALGCFLTRNVLRRRVHLHFGEAFS